jgi:hypothetical protein
MTADTKRLLFRLGLAVVAAGAVYFLLQMLTPACGKVIGYANEQPAMQVVRLSNTTDAEVVRILRLMDSLFRQKPVLHEDTWPNPSLVEEHTNCWLVVFAHKIPVYRFLGITQTATLTAPNLYITVKKPALTVHFGNWCQ